MPVLKTKPINGKAYLGIDPGIGGGVALIVKGKIHSVSDMPSTEKDFHTLIKNFSQQWDILAAIELIPTAIFGVGKTSMSKLYGNYMACRMVMVCNNIPFTEVGAKVWQAKIGIAKKPKEATNIWKDRLRQKAQNLYPEFNWDDYGVTFQRTWSDAILIARYRSLIQ